MIKELRELGVNVYGYDPLLSREEIEGPGVKALDELKEKMDCVILNMAHQELFSKMEELRF